MRALRRKTGRHLALDQHAPRSTVTIDAPGATIFPGVHFRLPAIAGASSSAACPFPGFIKERAHGDAECFCDMPKADDRRIPLPLLQTANVSSVHAHPMGKFRLRKLGSQPKPSDVVPHHAPHVFRHAYNATRCCILMRRIILHISDRFPEGVNAGSRQVGQEHLEQKPSEHECTSWTFLCRRIPDGHHGDRPWRSCRDSYQSVSNDRLLRELTTEHGIHDECLRWTFECIDVASPVLERLPAKPRRRSESGYQNNRVRCRPFRLE
jgi:hypothetical protein